MLFFIVLLLALQSHIFFAADSSNADETKRKSLILALHKEQKIPCWPKSCQERCPRCPWSVSNKKYDDVIDKLFAETESGKQDPFKQDCRTLVREGYGCWNSYQLCWRYTGAISCALLIRSACEGYGPTVTIPYLGLPCTVAPCVGLCVANTCCLQAVKVCDLCTLDYLSQQDFSMEDEEA